MGVATFPADADDVEGLVRNSDNALYIAKSRGKNQVVLYGADRRSFRRIKANLDGSYCIVEDEVRPFTTLDVSEAGLLLLTDRKLLLGQLLDIKMKLPDATPPVGCAGRVVRVQQNGSGRYEAGISIDRIGPMDRTRLVRFLRGEKAPVASERSGVA